MPNSLKVVPIGIFLSCSVLLLISISNPGSDEAAVSLPRKSAQGAGRIEEIEKGGKVGKAEKLVLSGPVLVAPAPAYSAEISGPEFSAPPLAPDVYASAHADQVETPVETPAGEATEPLAETPDSEGPPADDDASKIPPPVRLPKVEPEPKPEPKRELTAAMTALRDRVRKTLNDHRRALLNTRENTATEMMLACLPYGCKTEVHLGGSNGKRINGITLLCWNYPCAGYEPLALSEGRIAARIGYGLQEHPSQLLATLALARVRPNYPIRVGEDVRTVADLVEHEKLGCRSGTDLSLKLIGLAHFVKEPSWKNDLGEQWSHERIVREELAKPVVGAPDGGTTRLLGLGYAIFRRGKRKQPIEGQYARAQKYLNEFQDFALSHQNADGSWGPQFIAAKSTSRNPAVQLRATGCVLQWLAVSMPDDRLEDPRVVRAVAFADRLLGSGRYRQKARSLSTREIGSVMRTLHALALYDERYFQPADPAPQPPAAETPRATAEKPAGKRSR